MNGEGSLSFLGIALGLVYSTEYILKNGLILSFNLAIFIGLAATCMIGFIDDLLFSEFILKSILAKLDLLEPRKKVQ